MLVEPLRHIIEVAFGAGEVRGALPEELRLAESALESPLHEPMRDFYMTVGRDERIMEGDLHFRPVTELHWQEGVVEICDENQRIAVWGISREDWSLPNPAVVGRAAGGQDWATESLRVSAFLLNRACWQVIMRMPETWQTSLPQRETRRLEASMAYLAEKSIRAGNLRKSFAQPKRQLLATYLSTIETLYIGANDLHAIEAFETETGLELESL